MATTQTQKTQKHSFAAETGKVLELLTHSIYSNKEIFLRELISNANDAIDKARIASLTDTNFLWDDTDFRITIDIDPELQTLTISDNGIGMSEKQMHDNLGTIAKSGTKEFLEKLQKQKQASEHALIGQFWVGFYSAFMVADRVEVLSKSATGKQANLWSSDGSSGYTIERANKDGRWTSITLHFSEGNEEFLQDWKLRELIKKYSNYISTPIMMKEFDSRSEEEQKKQPKEYAYEKVNETTPIWKKSKTSIKDEEYETFYQSISMDFQPPLTKIHANVEGNVNYTTLLYLPQEANMLQDMRDPNKEYGPKLYVQNVLILEHAKELLPVWLRFVSGIVETSDLPLNISREMLQSNTSLDIIKKSLTKKILSELKKLRKNTPEAYAKFFSHFWPILKEGVYYEASMKEDIAEILEFETLLGDTKVSLDEYLASSTQETKGDKTIYYITGKSRNDVMASPYLEQFRKNNVDVLLLTDPIDEWLVEVLKTYKDIPLISITSNDISLTQKTEEQQQQEEKTRKEYKDVLELVKNIIGTDVLEKVELNSNLWDALGAIKTPEGGMNSQMEKMMKAMGQDVPKTKRILQLNPHNPLVIALKREFKNDIKSKKLQDIAHYAYMQALLLEWYELTDVAKFVQMTNTFAGEYLK